MKQDFNLVKEKLLADVQSQRDHSGACEEHRCHCGQLLARATPLGIELKCKRCKRLTVIPFKVKPLSAVVSKA